MTAKIIDLAEWQSAHPPIMRLMTAQARTFYAWQRYNAILARTWFSMVVIRC